MIILPPLIATKALNESEDKCFPHKTDVLTGAILWTFITSVIWCNEAPYQDRAYIHILTILLKRLIGDLNTDEPSFHVQNVHLNPNFVHYPFFQQIKFWACNAENIKLLRICQERWSYILELPPPLHIMAIAFAWYTGISQLQIKISRFAPVCNFLMVTFFPPLNGLQLKPSKILYHLFKYLRDVLTCGETMCVYQLCFLEE